MHISDVMAKRVYTIDVADSLAAAALKMRTQNVGALPVCRGERVIGIITDRDIVTRAVALARDPVCTPVFDAMTLEATSCLEDMEVWEAARLMEEQAIWRLVVTDREGRVVGMLSYDDLALLPPGELEEPEIVMEDRFRAPPL